MPNETRAARQPQPQTTQAEAAARAAFAAESLEPQAWANPAGARYDWHTHPYHKVLFCLRGAITFHTPAGDRLLAPGDRLDLPPGTRHAATVGPTGVTCLEAARPAPRAKPRPALPPSKSTPQKPHPQQAQLRQKLPPSETGRLTAARLQYA